MIRKSLTCLPWLLVLLTVAAHAQKFNIKKNLAADWKIFENNAYQQFKNGEGVNAVYFSVDADEYSNDYLKITSNKPFHLFINGKLAASGDTKLLKIDSLITVFPSPWTVAIRREKISDKGLATQILTRENIPSPELLQKRTASFRDFGIIGFLVLAVMGIVIVRLNPKLAADYFSVTKIFTLRESEESQAYSRITSSTNFLFYIFSSLMIGYYLMIIFHFLPESYATALAFRAEGFYQNIMLWLKLSLIILIVFFLKIILVYGLTFLFGAKEVAGIHFFNWVRLMVVIFGALTIILSVYFVVHGQSAGFFIVWLKLLAWITAAWMILILLKLSSRMGHSMFHLFSYICATELIPFLITIKVLYN